MRRLLVALVLLVAVAAEAAERAHVYLVIVDGLDARLATAATMPRLFGAIADDTAHATRFRDARAVMPTRTNPNHVSLLTGVYPEAHGITGNAYWSRRKDVPPDKMDDAKLIEVETLFTVAAAADPPLVTFGVFGKPKLGRLFDVVPGRERAPTVLWAPDRAPGVVRDPATGYSDDATTIDALLAAAVEREPDLAAVNLSDVDRNAHGHGPDSPECAAAIAGADRAIGRLLDALHAAGRWERSVVIVTADHGFDTVAPTAERPQPSVLLRATLEGARDEDVRALRTVADGGVAHVYDARASASELGGAEDTLARAATLLRAATGVAEVLARLPVPGVKQVAEAHPDWRVAGSERAGDLLVVASRGFQFVDEAGGVDASLKGNHGGPSELGVPLVVLGGSPRLKPAPPDAVAHAVDVAPTMAALVGLSAGRRIDGGAIDARDRGRALDVVR